MEIDLVSFFTACFGSLLSAYNWWKMKNPAEIHPNEIINYGLISSSYEESLFLTFPLIFHNEGFAKGMITGIKIGFKHGSEIKYLDIDAKVRLEELNYKDSENMTLEKYQESGYKVLKPTYPIVVDAFHSIDITVVSMVPYNEEIIPVGKETECVIEVQFSKDKSNRISFPFLLTQEMYDSDNILLWIDAKSNLM